MDVYFGPLSFVYLKGLRHSADPLRVDGCMAAGRQAIVSEILALGPSRRSDLKIVGQVFVALGVYSVRVSRV